MQKLKGVLLVNLGTPDSPSTKDVRVYLAEFLNDPLVIGIPPALRRLLVHGIILRTRPAKSAKAYQEIWTDRGSPLLFHGVDLAERVKGELGDEVAAVELAMRYRNPSVQSKLEEMQARGVDDLIVVPLFPQYSQAAWASAVKEVFDAAARMANMPNLQVVEPYYEAPHFLDATVEVARPVLDEFQPDHVLLSFHGVPDNHCTDRDTSGSHCQKSDNCCDQIVAQNRFCYRAQCFATARGLQSRLGLDASNSEVAFQSRLTKDWIRPFTDERVVALAKQGVKRLAVLCPSFVADCLETIEEIGMRAAEDFVEAGGEALQLVPCVNAEVPWAKGLAAMVRENL
ncbi:MAG: ferrochelatase [Planctomycetota bacterium]